MSYILEALKKAEQARSRGAVPDLQASHRAEAEQPDRRRWILALVVVFLLLQGLWLLFYLRGTPGVDTEYPLASAASMPPSPPAAPAPVVESVTHAPVDRTAPTIVLEPPAAASTAPATAASTVPATPTTAREAAPLQAINPWQQASAAVRQLAAGLSLDVHVYAEQPAQRFVLINMRRYREGERLEAGAVLERITPQGVVLSYQGEQFRYDHP